MMMMVARKSSSDRRIFGDRRLLISMMVSLSYEDGQVFNEFCLFDIVDKNDGDKKFHLKVSSYSCIVSSGTCDGGLALLLLLLVAGHLPHPRLLLPPGAGHGPAEVRGGWQCRILTCNHPGQIQIPKKLCVCTWKSFGHPDFPRGLVQSQLVEEVAHLHADDQQKGQLGAVDEEVRPWRLHGG